MARTRSPRYPSISLSQAIEKTQELHDIERANPVDREVAAQAMGYNGLTGTSATVLAGMMQYGLLEKTGKNEVRVSRLAIEILYPDSSQSKADAIREAADKPELFRDINERFSDGQPSENALRAYLMKQDFTHAAVPSAIKAYMETVLFVENATGNESYGSSPDEGLGIVENQQVGSEAAEMKPQSRNAFAPQQQDSSKGKQPASVQFVDKSIWLNGVLENQEEAGEFITVLTALKPMLPAKPSSEAPSGDEIDDLGI